MALDRSPLRKSQPVIFQAIVHELEIFLRSELNSPILTKSISDMPSCEKQLSKEETLNLLAVSETGFYQLINTHLEQPSPDGMYSFDDVIQLRNTLCRLVTLNEAAKILNISPHNTKKLLKSGIITAFRSPDIDSYRDILIDAKVLNDLLEAIEKTPLKESEQQGVPLAMFLKKYQIISGRTLDELINAVIDNQLSIVKFDKDAGLMGINFSEKELFKFIDFKTEDTSGLLDINVIISELNSYRDAVYRIMSAGLLQYEKRKINLKSEQRYVKQEELARFKTKYILPSEIAELYQVNVTNIAERLKHLGVFPVSGPTIDNGLVYVFERSAVFGISKQQLDEVEGHQTRTGRPKKGHATVKGTAQSDYIDAQAVAELLGNGTSIQKVARLVRAGLLQAVQHNGELGNKRYFTLEAVQLYLKLFRDNPKLIKLEAIPDWLIIDKRRLEVDWLKSGRLALVDDGLGQRYASIDTLESIKALREYALSTNELAESVGKTRFDVGNAIRLGKLKPISGPSCDDFPNFLFERESSIQSFA